LSASKVASANNKNNILQSININQKHSRNNLNLLAISNNADDSNQDEDSGLHLSTSSKKTKSNKLDASLKSFNSGRDELVKEKLEKSLSDHNVLENKAKKNGLDKHHDLNHDFNSSIHPNSRVDKFQLAKASLVAGDSSNIVRDSPSDIVYNLNLYETNKSQYCYNTLPYFSNDNQSYYLNSCQASKDGHMSNELNLANTNSSSSITNCNLIRINNLNQSQAQLNMVAPGSDYYQFHSNNHVIINQTIF
jgi:hypothetical protein